MKETCSRSYDSDSDGFTESESRNELSYIFVKSKISDQWDKDKKIADFLNMEGIFQVNAPEAFKL